MDILDWSRSIDLNHPFIRSGLVSSEFKFIPRQDNQLRRYFEEEIIWNWLIVLSLTFHEYHFLYREETGPDVTLTSFRAALDTLSSGLNSSLINNYQALKNTDDMFKGGFEQGHHVEDTSADLTAITTTDWRIIKVFIELCHDFDRENICTLI